MVAVFPVALAAAHLSRSHRMFADARRSWRLSPQGEPAGANLPGVVHNG
jgi:hypothetical protein